MAVESSLKPSDPGCLTRDMADGSSTASAALKLTSPNTRAWVSGWALSWWHPCVKNFVLTVKCYFLNPSQCFETIWKYSQESWIYKAATESQPGSQIQTWWDCTSGRIHQHRCRGKPSLCCRRKSLPGSARGRPSHGRRPCHLEQSMSHIYRYKEKETKIHMQNVTANQCHHH